MNIEKLKELCPKLLDYMVASEYSDDYIKLLKVEIRWILNNHDKKSVSSYEHSYTEPDYLFPTL